jgi:hypothetical protein
MPELTYFDVVFKPLDETDDVSSFHSTEQELDDFLREDAFEDLVVFSNLMSSKIFDLL